MRCVNGRDGSIDERVATSIKRSFERGSSSDGTDDSDAADLELGTPYWQFPNFFTRKGGELGSPQADHFGLYALAKAVHADSCSTQSEKTRTARAAVSPRAGTSLRRSRHRDDDLALVIARGEAPTGLRQIG
jgi:hypothetical protein